MLDQKLQKTAPSRRRGRPPGLVACVALVTVAAIAMFAAMALASSSATPTVGSASNVKFSEKIVVNEQGRTLYVLSPETTRHLLCKSSECLKFWPPLTVPSSKTKLTAGPGVHGHLGIVRRGNGTFQVTLGGLPLYRFSGDHAKGEASGESVHSFGGTWHAISATTNATPAPAGSETETTPTTTTPTTTTPTTTTPTTTTPTTTTPPSEKYGY
jgi:predicted lipoprotein with Yx(FWY)xxD motif